MVASQPSDMSTNTCGRRLIAYSLLPSDSEPKENSNGTAVHEGASEVLILVSSFLFEPAVFTFEPFYRLHTHRPRLEHSISYAHRAHITARQLSMTVLVIPTSTTHTQYLSCLPSSLAGTLAVHHPGSPFNLAARCKLPAASIIRCERADQCCGMYPCMQTCKLACLEIMCWRHGTFPTTRSFATNRLSMASNGVPKSRTVSYHHVVDSSW